MQQWSVFNFKKGQIFVVPNSFVTDIFSSFSLGCAPILGVLSILLFMYQETGRKNSRRCILQAGRVASRPSPPGSRWWRDRNYRWHRTEIIYVRPIQKNLRRRLVEFRQRGRPRCSRARPGGPRRPPTREYRGDETSPPRDHPARDQRPIGLRWNGETVW